MAPPRRLRYHPTRAGTIQITKSPANRGNLKSVNLALAPDGLLQNLLNAFLLEIHYDPTRRHARLHITLSAVRLRLTIDYRSGPEADSLARTQYDAIMEVLQWLRVHH